MAPAISVCRRPSRSARVLRNTATATSPSSVSVKFPFGTPAFGLTVTCQTAPLPLTDAERNALLKGDVVWLFEHGAHPFLLTYLIRWEIFGLTAPIYSERIRTAHDPN